MKYQTSSSQSEILPNKLGITDAQALGIAEFEGFLQAEILLTQNINPKTKLNTKYLQEMHRLALGEVYDFAEKWRTVNLSKGGFVFASAQFLSQTMQVFENEMLKTLPKRYESKIDFLNDIARIHAELLFIHPFREGNGRTARLFVNLLCRKYSFDIPNWNIINNADNFTTYVKALQQAAGQNYQPMQKLMNQLF